MQEEGKREDTFDLAAQSGEEEGDLKTKKEKKIEKKMSFLLELMNDDPSKKKEGKNDEEESKEKNVDEDLDTNMLERKAVAMNIPGLSLLLCGDKSSASNNEIFIKHCLPLLRNL